MRKYFLIKNTSKLLLLIDIHHIYIMGQNQSMRIAESICSLVENKEWLQLLHILRSNTITNQRKQTALMSIRRGGMKSPFLSLASSYGAPYEVMKIALNICGNELLLLTNDSGATVLHSGIKAPLDRLKLFLACSSEQQSTRAVLLMLMKVGGYSPLQHAIVRGATAEEVELFVEYGGKEVLMQRDGCHGRTSLQLAMHFGCSAEVVKLLISSGGEELISKNDEYGATALDYFIQRNRSLRYNETVMEKKEILTILLETASFEEYGAGIFRPYGLSGMNQMGISIAGLQALEVNVLRRWGILYWMDDFSGFFMDVVSKRHFSRWQLGIMYLNKR